VIHLDDYENFRKLIRDGVEYFNSIPQNKSIRLVGHLDADGICASAIMINALMKLNRRYALTTMPTLTEDSLTEIGEEPEEYFIFVDLGYGNLDAVGKVLTKKHIIILDHHIPQSDTVYSNVSQINPHLCNIDGSDEISGAGVVFMFTRELLNGSNIEMSRIAIVGAVGDIQEHDGFKRLNREILELAVTNRLIEVKKGLKFFGVQTKPIHKLLQYSSDIIIPGVTGSESGSINFMIKLGIDPQTKKGFKKISDLTEDEKKRLIAGIITHKTKESTEDVLTNTYILLDEKEDTSFRDAKEFATLLNSCGRLNKASIGIGACLNDQRMKSMALDNLSDYRRELVNALNWYKENSDSGKIIKNKKYIIINAEDEVMPTMIGTLGSILSKSPDLGKNTFILSLARNHDDTTKISLRITGNSDAVSLKEIIEEIISKINHGSSGGHSHAAGAVISTDKEDDFIHAAEQVLEKTVIEERV